MKSRIFFVAIAAAFAVASASADDIQLKNGQKYSGIISREGDMMVIRTEDGKTITAHPEDIAAVTLNETLTPEQAATADWTRITQQIKTADNLQAIIKLHKDFLEKYPDAPQEKDVRSSLAVYQNLADNDGVKFRGRWIPRAQIDVMLRQWKESARPATDLYHQGQYKDALEAAKATLTSDALNPDALTIAGLSAFRLDDAKTARTYFTSLVTADPTSLLAENNLAVVSFLQKLPAEGMIHYERALAIKPDNRLLLDNIEEALTAYIAGGGEKTAPVYLALKRQFEPAEKKMEQRMAQSDKASLSRWGATWVTKSQLKKLQDYVVNVDTVTRVMAIQENNAKAAISLLDNLIKRVDDEDSQQLQFVNYYHDVLNGNAGNPTGANPAVQFNAASQNVTILKAFQGELEEERDTIAADAKEYLVEAEKVRAILDSGPGKAASGYTGKQQIMDPGDVDDPPQPQTVADPPAVPHAPAPAHSFISPPPLANLRLIPIVPIPANGATARIVPPSQSGGIHVVHN